MENKSASDLRDDIISDKPNLSETSLAEGIIATEKNPRYDAAVKRLLSEKVILAWIMKTCLEEYNLNSRFFYPAARKSMSTNVQNTLLKAEF